MELEKQVCSYVQAKKLSELGVDQKNLFSWSKSNETQPAVLQYGNDNMDGWIPETYSAFTVAELAVMIDPYWYIQNAFFESEDKWKYVPVLFDETADPGGLHSTPDFIYEIANENLAECYAGLVIYLLTERSYKVSEFNERLAS